MADLAKLVVRLEAESLKFQKELDAAKRKLNSFEKDAKKSASVASSFFAGFAKELAAIVTVGAFVKMTKGAIDLADSTSKAAQKIGVTTEALSQLRYAADLSGLSAEQLDASLLKLNRSLGEASVNADSKAGKAFRALGVAVENADGSSKTADETIEALADRFAKMEDGAVKTTVAMDLFGKSGAQLIPLLNGGSKAIREARDEADRLGQTITGNTAKAAEAFNDNLSRLQKALQGAFIQSTGQLLPVLSALTDSIVQTTKDTNAMRGAAESLAAGFRILISAGILVKGTFQTIGVAIAGVAAAISEIDFGRIIASGLGPIGQLVAGLDTIKDGTSATGQSAEILGQTFSDITKQMEEDGKLIDKIWSDNAASAESSSSVTRGSAAAVGDALKGMSAEAKKAANEQKAAMEQIAGLVTQLRTQVDTYEQGEGAVIRYRIAHGDLAQTFATAGAGAAQYKEQLIGLTDQLEAQVKLTEQTRIAQQTYEGVLQRGRQVAESVRTPLEVYQDSIVELNDLLKQGAINQETYNRAVKEAGKTYEEAINKSSISLEDIAKNAAQNIQGALSDFLFDPFADGTKSMGEQFSEMLRRMAAEVAAAAIMEHLFGIGKGGASISGSGGGWIGTAVSAIGMIFGARANGGPVNAGQPYIVGERGPELVIPNSNGQVMDAHSTSAMGGSQVNVFVTTPDANSFRASRRQVAGAIKRGVDV